MSTHSKESTHHALGTFLLALLLVLAAMLLMGQSAVTSDDDPVDGKEIFESVCTTCHTVQPPPNLAPPMAMIVRHYRMALTDSAAVRDALVSWIGSPDSSKSLLPAHAIDRFGLMAPLALSPEEVSAVAGYVMTLDAGMSGGGMGGMMGMDSTAAMQECPRMEGMQAHRCGMNH